MGVSIEIPGYTTEEAEAIAQMALGSNPSLNLGPWIMGPIFDAILLGVLSQQFITWWTWSSKERMVVKILIAWCAINAVAFSAYEIRLCLFNFAENFGKWRTFLEVPYLVPVLFWDGMTGMPIQAFYVHRAYRLNNNNIFIVILAGLIMATAFGAGISTLYYVRRLSSELEATKVNAPVFIWLGSMMAADLVITACVGWGLHRSRTGWANTDTLVRRLILLTVETQLAPTLVTLGFLIEFSIDPPGSIGIFFEICQSKFYICGFLATLNSRFHLKKEMQGISGSNQQAKSNTYALGNSRLQQATVNVTTDTYVESFNIPAERHGINRDPAYELKEIPEASDIDSIENLDYAKNVSKKNLNEQSYV